MKECRETDHTFVEGKCAICGKVGLKTLADLCIFMASGIEITEDVLISWRKLKKFMDDFEHDNNLEIIIRPFGHDKLKKEAEEVLQILQNAENN